MEKVMRKSNSQIQSREKDEDNLAGLGMLKRPSSLESSKSPGKKQKDKKDKGEGKSTKSKDKKE